MRLVIDKQSDGGETFFPDEESNSPDALLRVLFYKSVRHIFIKHIFDDSFRQRWSLNSSRDMSNDRTFSDLLGITESERLIVRRSLLPAIRKTVARCRTSGEIRDSLITQAILP